MFENAPTLATVGLRALNFLLSIFGAIAIIGLIIAGILYLTAGGNENRIEIAKRAFFYSIVGITVVFGLMIVIRTMSGFIQPAN